MLLNVYTNGCGPDRQEGEKEDEEAISSSFAEEFQAPTSDYVELHGDARQIDPRTARVTVTRPGSNGWLCWVCDFKACGGALGQCAVATAATQTRNHGAPQPIELRSSSVIQPEQRNRQSRLVWAGYLASVWGLAFAAISFYWGSGGTLGVDTVWGSLGMSPTQHAVLILAVWVTGFLKVFGGVFALALVTRWGTRLPVRPLAVMGWAAAGLLTLYGGVNVIAEALTASGIVKPTQPVDWKPLLWHLYLWDMSFLIWGILFGLAAWHFTRTNRGRVQSTI